MIFCSKYKLPPPSTNQIKYSSLSTVWRCCCSAGCDVNAVDMQYRSALWLAASTEGINASKIQMTKRLVWSGSGTGAGTCCDMGQNDTIDKIELNPSIVLSSESANSRNNIQLFPQLFDEHRVNGDCHLHLQVLWVKQTVEWQFTH